MSETHLYLFQIGPVQAFIAQARRTQDLYIGSRMLSALAGAGVMAAAEQPGFKPIFPVPLNNALPHSVPHRFAFRATADPQQVAEAVRAAVESHWRSQFADPVAAWLRGLIGGGDWEAVYRQQATEWLEFNWVAIAYQSEQHKTVFAEANAAIRARRLARGIYNVEQPGDKCTLTGAQSALPIDWKRLRKALNDPKEILLRNSERLGALALIKRFAAHTPINRDLIPERFPSTDEIAGVPPEADRSGKDVRGYLAVLHMDGDRMGKRLSELTTLIEHQEFSRQLAEFAQNIVPGFIAGYERAVLVYAGGDDVLALLPLSIALEVADRLQAAFKELTGCSASAGIALTPYNLPLDSALELARRAETDAKDRLGRDAVVVTEAHGTGQIRAAGSTWRVEEPSEPPINLAKLLRDLQNYFATDQISGKLGYDVQQLAHDLTGDASIVLPPEARRAEFKRLLKRRIGEGVSADERTAIVNDLGDTLANFAELQPDGWNKLANWLILARFMAQGAARKEPV